jgi:hypothetical protein
MSWIRNTGFLGLQTSSAKSDILTGRMFAEIQKENCIVQYQSMIIVVGRMSKKRLSSFYF